MRRYGPLVVFAVALLLAVSSATPAAQDVYYVQSLKAKVMSGPSFKAGVLGEVGKGVKFAALAKEGSWIKINYNAKTGYVSSMLLSPHAPLEKMSLIKGEGTDIKQSVRRRASTYTSAAAARGLTADDRRRLSRDEKVDYAALEKVEAFTVSADDVARFSEGKL
jgi:uncharacterized protein YgiM (DUF1202 family)